MATLWLTNHRVVRALAGNGCRIVNWGHGILVKAIEEAGKSLANFSEENDLVL